MATLADFNTGPPAAMLPQQFAGGQPAQAPVPFNQDTIDNIAAHAAVLSSPENVLPTYSAVNNELSNNGMSPTLDNLTAQRKALDNVGNFNTVQSALADPNTSVEDKTKLLSAYTSSGVNPDNPVTRSLGTQVATAAAMAPSSSTDNDETEYTRVDTVKAMDQVDAWNGWVSTQANNIRRLQTSDGLTNTLNVLEGLVPFLSQGTQAQIAHVLSPSDNEFSPDKGVAVGKALVLMGENRNDIANAVSSMPIGDRMAFGQKLIDLIKASGGSITGRPNDLQMINELQQSLTAGGYGQTQRVIDDITSVLDLTLIGGPLFKGAKAALSGAGKLVSVGADTAEAARAEEALNRMGKTVDDTVASAQPEAAVAPEAAQATSVPETPVSTPTGQPAAPTGPLASASEVDPKTVQSTSDIILQNVHKELNDLGVQPGVIADTKAAIAKKITPTSITDPNLPMQITNTIRQVIRKNSLDGIPPPVLKNIRAYVDARSSVIRRTVRTDVDFGSVSQSIKDANPEQARTMLNTATAAPDDTVAKALYGTTKTEAAADAILPEMGEAGGTVRGKPVIDDITPDQSFIAKQAKDQGYSYLSDSEKAGQRAAVIADFSDINGLVARKEMSSIEESPAKGVKFSQVLGPKDGGFSNGAQAYTQAKFGLRKYGVTDDQLELLQRDPTTNDYAPVTKGTDVTKPGDYLVRVNHNYEYSPTDTVNWSTTSANNWKFFDAFHPWTDGKQGGFANHIIPAVNINDTLLTTPATVAAQRAASFYKDIEKLGQNYAEKLGKLPSYQKNLVRQYIIKANNERIKFNPASLKAIGMSDEGIDTVRTWKVAQDTNYHYENVDLNKTLRAKGWMRYVDQTGDSDLIARQIPEKSIVSSDKIIGLDGKITKISTEEASELYEKGGFIAQLRRPMELDGETVEHIIVANNSESSYLRRINDEDHTLAYIDGHYSVRYTDPYFITKTVNGVDRAVATAGTRQAAINV